ncbi:acyl-CoA dehydrogenase family protein [Nocardia miyunensis]|uniref:acyl-CoA dehydrogenase family protein n=1 Tax=Nocardia miyunensis TaxID=282684 RepID=UPI0008350BCA|nr:acyl-CoA dehydrogenase family protein [Nocardia miyunensis]
MDFSLTDEQRMLVESTRQMLARQSPIAGVRALAEGDGPGFDPDVWERGSALGWPALPIPEEFGGLGRDLIDLALITEEHGRSAQPGPLASHALVAIAITESGYDDLRSAVLPSLASGEFVATWAFAEPRESWEPDGVHAEVDQNSGGFRLNGVKTAVQDADAAQLILVTARLNNRFVHCLVDPRTNGVIVRRQRTLDLTRRFAEVRLADVLVPGASVLVVDDAALARQLRYGAVLVCADSLGIGARVLEMSIEYAKLRAQFGRPIGSFQAVKHRCARMRMWLQASQAATYYAAMAVAADAEDAEEATGIAKAYTSSAIADLTSEALQLHGGIGFTWEHDLHLYHRRARANQVLFGDPSLHYERLTAALE